MGVAIGCCGYTFVYPHREENREKTERGQRENREKSENG